MADKLIKGNDGFSPRRIIRSSRPTEIFQPPQQGFFSVHAQLQLLGKIVKLLGNYIVNMIRYMHRVHIFTRDETGLVCLPTQLERTGYMYCTKLIGRYGWLHRNKKD
jgi:hypothetical protein